MRETLNLRGVVFDIAWGFVVIFAGILAVAGVDHCRVEPEAVAPVVEVQGCREGLVGFQLLPLRSNENAVEKLATFCPERAAVDPRLTVTATHIFGVCRCYFDE